MTTVEEIEETISALAPGEFNRLLDWMCARHLDTLTADGFESSELEEEMLKGLEGTPVPVDEKFFASLRANIESRARASGNS